MSSLCPFAGAATGGGGVCPIKSDKNSAGSCPTKSVKNRDGVCPVTGKNGAGIVVHLQAFRAQNIGSAKSRLIMCADDIRD
jgi:hypothetical protein